MISGYEKTTFSINFVYKLMQNQHLLILSFSFLLKTKSISEFGQFCQRISPNASLSVYQYSKTLTRQMVRQISFSNLSQLYSVLLQDSSYKWMVEYKYIFVELQISILLTKTYVKFSDLHEVIHFLILKMYTNSIYKVFRTTIKAEYGCKSVK